MKVIPIGRGGVVEIWSSNTYYSGTKMVASNNEWDQIEIWCRKNKIYYSKSGNTMSFFNDKDVTAFMLRWA